MSGDLKLATNSSDSDLRRDAVGRLTDQSVLAAIAKSDNTIFVCEAALERIFDKDLLRDVARNAKDVGIRDAAETRLRYLASKQ